MCKSIRHWRCVVRRATLLAAAAATPGDGSVWRVGERGHAAMLGPGLTSRCLVQRQANYFNTCKSSLVSVGDV
eukprot:4649211-Pleurochrysis_carterae.AAC.1